MPPEAGVGQWGENGRVAFEGVLFKRTACGSTLVRSSGNIAT